MSNQLIQTGGNSVAILKKPVLAISEGDKNLLKATVDKWAKNAKAQKIHKPIELIAERDKLLIEWLFNTGMRISDALAIKFRDINISKEEVTFIVKKRSRVKPFLHTISLDKSILFETQRFKEMFLLKPEDLIFKLTRSTFDDNLKKYCVLAGLQKYSAHKFRHGCAMKDMAEGQPDFVTAFRLAHSSTSVTNSTYRRMSSDIERAFRQRKGMV
jgi:integrase